MQAITWPRPDSIHDKTKIRNTNVQDPSEIGIAARNSNDFDEEGFCFGFFDDREV